LRSNEIGGTKGIPDKRQDLNRKGASDEVARDLGWMRGMGVGTMLYLEIADGPLRLQMAMLLKLTLDRNTRQRRYS
jgi:hypothetical protein